MFKVTKILSSSFVLITAAGTPPVSLAADAPKSETNSQKRLRELLRANVLAKITAGPQDSYQAVVSPDQKTIYYTRNEKLASHVYRQDIAGAISRAAPVITENYDTRDPAVSPDGKRLAVTSFENNARGDICIVMLENKTRECLNTLKRGAEQPAWMSDSELAFIEHGTDDEKSSLVTYNLTNKQKTILFSDDVVSFTVHPSRQSVVYASSDSAKQSSYPTRVLKMREIAGKGEGRVVSVDLPGLSGFPRFDDTGNWLYFSQFFSDTNNDHTIDANDHSVIFRIGADKLKSNSLILPEQITSIENNCNYVLPSKGSLYLTCAFEDSLDVYSLPAEGSIPSNWNLERLKDAHRSARTIPERILILNTMRFRYLQNDTAIIEQIFSNHVVGLEYIAAQYYLEGLQKKATAGQKDTFDMYKIYLQTAQGELEQTLGRPSPAFIARVSSAKNEVQGKLKANETLGKILLAYLTDMQGNSTSALSEFRKIATDSIRDSMTFYMYGHVGSRIFNKAKAASADWQNLYTRLAKTTLFTEESQSYYSLLLLLQLERAEPNLDKRATLIKSMFDKEKDDSVYRSFLETEMLIIDVAKLSDEKARRDQYMKLDKIFVKNEKLYFLRRGLYIRALTVFSDRNLENQLNEVASRWLTSTVSKEAEYIYAREQYTMIRLDKAYAYMAQSKDSLAADVFYTLIRITDDPEAHVGYFKMLTAQKKRAELEKEYKDLVKKNFVGDNIRIYEALKAIEDNTDGKGAEVAQAALDQDTSFGFNPAIREMLLGYTTYQRVLASKNRLEYNVSLAEESHRHYMVALDLSRNNKRLQAAILYNLGLLHFATHNYGDAVSFLLVRGRIPFVNDAEELDYRWLLARAQFYYRAPFEAYQNAREGLKIARKLKDKNKEIALLERTAFYASSAGEYSDSNSLYAEYLKQAKVTPLQKAKAQLAYGYSLLKSSKKVEAKKTLSEAKTFFEKNRAQKLQSTTGIVETNAQRLEVVALGLMAESESDAKRASDLRSQRLKLMEGWEGDLKAMALKKEDWRDYLLRDCNTISASYAKQNNWNQAAKQQADCSKRAADLYDVSSDALDVGLYQHTLNSLIIANNAKQVDAQVATRIQADTILSKLEPLASGNDAIALRWVRLGAESIVFDAKTNKRSAADAKKALTDMAMNEKLKDLKPATKSLVDSSLQSASQRL